MYECPSRFANVAHDVLSVIFRTQLGAIES
jgi:hypothetical protein